MSRHERRYQKYLARHQKHGMSTALPGVRGTLATASEVNLAAAAPVHETLVPSNLFEQGLGNLVFSRALPDGRIAMAVFLLDMYCLGAKNAFIAVVGRSEYGLRLSRWSGERLQPVQPACFRKLVEGGVEYARELGFNPHPDYALASKIFGDVRSADCPTRFVYGHDGKPLYISGPNESPDQVRAIIEQLERRLGAGNFDFLVLAG